MSLKHTDLSWKVPLLSAAAVVFCQFSEASPVRIEGLQTIPADQANKWIAPQIEFIESSGVSMARADDISFFLENALRDRGYKEATVDWKLENDTIILSVSEGSSILIGDISVSGNTTIDDAGVEELLTTATVKRVSSSDTSSLPYVAEDIKQGKKRIEEFYILLGFGDVSVDLETDFSNGNADIAVVIDEGQQMKVGSITLPAAPVPEIGKGYEEIQKDFSEQNFSAAIPANLETRLRALAVDAGYYNATITATPSSPRSADGFSVVDVSVDADWGERISVGSISVTGNEKVNSDFFERHFDELVNKPYSPDRTNAAVEELLQTGAFETVRTDLVENDDGTVSLDVEVEEGYSRTLGVYAGFATYEGPIGGFEFRNLNLFGSVRKVDATIELSSRGARGEVEYTDPWVLDSDYEFRGTLFAINRSEEGYEKFQTGGRYEFTRRLGREKKNALSFFGEASYTDVHDADISPIFLGDTEYFTHSAGFSLTHDRRDNPTAPRKGWIAQTSISVASSAIASDTEFLKATGRLGFYIPVRDHTLRLGARAGAISPMGNQGAIPIDLRFFNGGAYSVRSFPERELGPFDPATGYPTGGEFFTVFNAEYEIPIPAIDGLSIVPFADAGNLLIDSGDAGLDDLRYAIGLGIRYRTPIGPLRLEYGHNPDQRPGEPSGTFHAGFGFAY